MRCLRIDLRRCFSRYLDGELNARAVGKIEDHLLDCAWCRARLARMRDGQRFARRMPRPVLGRDPWSAIEASIEADHGRAAAMQDSPSRQAAWFKSITIKQAAAVGIAAAALLTAAVFVLLDQARRSDQQSASIFLADALDLEAFHAVRISEISRNTEPHVVAEGYVSEVRIDKDGDLSFRLVENLQHAEPFIVCEIVPSIKLAPPAVGSRVRVYGVSRYDAKAEHQWHEVHPVLNIEMVRH